MNALSKLLMKLLVITLAMFTLAGCASSTRMKNPVDPLESFNRGVYQFNDALDKSIVKPVAQGYNTVMPTPGKVFVNNFFSNLNDIVVTLNDLLQFKFVQAFSDSGRVLINSTIGVFGLIDVASQTGFEKHNEDFGQTLGYWGVGNGPYLVLPILGPSTFRDTLGFYTDTLSSQLSQVKPVRTRNELYLTKAINIRTQLLDREKLFDEAALDRYEFTRDTYLLHRKSLVYDGNPPHEKYEDDVELSPQSRKAPDTSVPSAWKAPASKPASKQFSSVDAASPSVYQVWLAQRTGIR